MAIVNIYRGPEAPRRVMLAVPTYSGDVMAECVTGLFGALHELLKIGVTSDFLIESGNCHVDDTRNSVVREFLKSDCEDLIFIDADVGFKASDVARLVSYDRDIVGGVYPKKEDELSFPVLAEGELWADEDGLVEVLGLPTGFLRIRRKVLEVLRDGAVSFIGQNGEPEPYHVIFERRIEAGKRWSGDYAFCRKARDAGFKLYADPEMSFSHTGNKSWRGALGDYWRRKAGLEPMRFERAIEALKAGDPTSADFLALWEGWGNDYALQPDAIAAMWRLAKVTKGPVLETGSGLSTLVMAAAGAEVHALEHDRAWYERTRGALARYSLSAKVHYAPLSEVDGLVWYGLEQISDLPEAFGLVLCDGPQRRWGREGLFRRLGDRIPRAVWIMDDADDPAQVAMLEREAGDREVHVMGEGRKIAICPPAAMSAAA